VCVDVGNISRGRGLEVIDTTSPGLNGSIVHHRRQVSLSLSLFLSLFLSLCVPLTPTHTHVDAQLAHTHTHKERERGRERGREREDAIRIALPTRKSTGAHVRHDTIECVLSL
jgi:hypothetical protein